MKRTIREIRRSKEISQQKTADAIGVHVNTYIGWERNSGRIPIWAAYELAAFFDVSIDDIFFESKSYKM